MAYVYSHTRVDTGEIFYIGIGSDKRYSRAFCKKGRNSYWHKITNKTEYTVTILLDGLTWEEACTEEILLIKKLGRKSEGGILVNITEGGDGFKSNHSQKTKDKIRDFYKGKSYEDIYGQEKAAQQRENRREGVANVWQNRTLEQRKAIAEKNSLAVLQYSRDMVLIREWISASEAGRDLQISMTAINHCLRGKAKTSGGFIWKYKNT
jgi:hypothetical protein